MTKVGAGRGGVVVHFFQALGYLWQKWVGGMEYLHHSTAEYSGLVFDCQGVVCSVSNFSINVVLLPVP